MARLALVFAAASAALAAATTPCPSPMQLQSEDATLRILLEVDRQSDLAALSAELTSFAASHNASSINVTLVQGAAWNGLAVTVPSSWAGVLQAALAQPPPDFAGALLVVASHDDVIMKLMGGSGGSTGSSSGGSDGGDGSEVIIASAATSESAGVSPPRQLADIIGALGGGTSAAGETTQPAPSTLWHLARIQSRSSVIDGTYTYTYDGLGVDMYVLDGGVNIEHVDFSGRIVAGFNAVSDQPPTDVSDCDGHGTHVTGLAAGTTHGVAKRADIIPV